MFEVDWHNSQTLLLNLTNLGLGILVVLSVGAALYDVGLDLVEKWRRSRHSIADGNVAAGHKIQAVGKMGPSGLTILR